MQFTILLNAFPYVGVYVQYHTSPERNSLLESINNFLPNRFQIVVLNGEATEWKKNNAGVPQGYSRTAVLHNLHK